MLEIAALENSQNMPGMLKFSSNLTFKLTFIQVKDRKRYTTQTPVIIKVGNLQKY